MAQRRDKYLLTVSWPTSLFALPARRAGYAQGQMSPHCGLGPVGGFRFESGRKMVGSLLLGLYYKEGLFHHVGFTSALSDSEKPGFTKRVQKLIAPPFLAHQSAGPTRPVLFVVGHRLAPFQNHCVCSRVGYRLVGSDLCLVTTTVLRCPLAVSVARRFLTSLSAWRWVENEPTRSSPMRTDQPTLVGSTRKIVVIACMATNKCSTNRRRSAGCGLAAGAGTALQPWT